MKQKILAVLIGLIGVSFLSNIDTVYADELDNKFYYDEWIENIFVQKVNGDDIKSQQARFFRRQSDGIPVYCIEAGPLIYSDEIYNSFTENFEDVTGYSKEQIERVKLIAYYGYGYNGQYDDKWYIITQMLIWKELYPYMDIYYTDTFKGNRIERFVEEENIILNLVDHHLLQPDFDEIDELTIGDEIVLEDSNNVLNEYEMETSDNVNIVKENNTLTIKAEELGETEVKFFRKPNRFNYIPIVYMNDKSQNLFMAGDYDIVERVINFDVVDVEKPKEEPPEEEKEIVTVSVPNTFQEKNNSIYLSSIASILLGSMILNVKRKNK